MPYELPVLKKSLEGKLPDVGFVRTLLEQNRIDPYIRGMRFLHLLETVLEVPSLELVPVLSPLREFIGGSGYLIPHNECS